jgi:large subunit ribosomal protein L18
MATIIKTKQEQRVHRHKRVRSRVSGTASRPRLAMFKSNTRLSAQLIDDEKGITLVAVSTASVKAKTPQERVSLAAVELAQQAKGKGITAVVFDRGGFEYTGVIKAFADSARAAGLEF